MKPALAVYDVMRRMTCPLITINTGLTVGTYVLQSNTIRYSIFFLLLSYHRHYQKVLDYFFFDLKNLW